MHLNATLTKIDVLNLFVQLAPLVIRLGDGGTLLVTAPAEVTMIPGEGVGVVCDATFHWPLLGVDLPVRMRSLSVRIRPDVHPDSAGQSNVLTFTLQIEHTGVSILPAMFDERVTARLNEELRTRNVELAWNFGKSLSHVFQLPPAVLSAAALALDVSIGAIDITESEIALAVHFVARVQPRTDGHTVQSPAAAGGAA
ncbi:MAG: hypothetical protein WBY94_16150 [Polyangiaceae bacterium]